MEKQRRVLLLSALCVLATTACQDVDTRATEGSHPPPPASTGRTEATKTPPIEMDLGMPPLTTRRACDLTTAQAIAILTDSCASCHGGRKAGENLGEPPFGFLLDFPKLLAARSAKAKDPNEPSLGMRFVIPGDPDHSRLYLLTASNPPGMPPARGMGELPLPAPTISDISVLRAWITTCLARPANPGPALHDAEGQKP